MKNPLMRFCVGALILAASTVAMALPTAKVTVEVLDENGRPISDAEAGLGCKKPNAGWGWGAMHHDPIRKQTDSDGMATISCETVNDIGVSAVKGGYYLGFERVTIESISGFGPFKRYKPWNPTITVKLKKKRNPIPMYARGIKTTIPAKGVPVGFDLEEGDWVIPYGSGRVKDFIFYFNVQTKDGGSEWDGVTAITFSNETDGIQDWYLDPDNRSVLRMPYHTPKMGYENKWSRREYSIWVEKEASSHVTALRKDQNYFFRIRSKKDDDGNVIGGLYGKIHGNISFSPRGILKFLYYLNPVPGDTNVEYNVGHNLAKEIKKKNHWARINIDQP